MRLRAVCLDVGEVLIDESRVWETWAALLGVSRFTLAASIGAELTTGRPFEAALDRFSSDWREREDEHEVRYDGFRDEDLYPDARDALARLREAGHTVAICGNQPARRTAQLRALDLPADLIATSDDLGVEKPAPAFFAALLAALRTIDDGLDAADVLYVGDRLDNDVVPARAAGLRTGWLRRGPWALLQPRPGGATADVTVDSLTELADTLTEQERHRG